MNTSQRATAAHVGCLATCPYHLSAMQVSSVRHIFKGELIKRRMTKRHTPRSRRGILGNADIVWGIAKCLNFFNIQWGRICFACLSLRRRRLRKHAKYIGGTSITLQVRYSVFKQKALISFLSIYEHELINSWPSIEGYIFFLFLCCHLVAPFDRITTSSFNLMRSESL